MPLESLVLAAALLAPALAGLVILDADPLADIGNLARVHRTIKGGVVYDPVVLMRSLDP